MTSDPLWFDLRNAVYSKDSAVAEALLKAHPHLRSVRNGIGETVLHFLAVENDLEGVAWLHDRGFGLNEKNNFGVPTVFEVAQLGYRELLLWFVEKGVDFGARDKDGQDILTYLREYEKDDMAQFLIEKVPNLALQATIASGGA